MQTSDDRMNVRVASTRRPGTRLHAGPRGFTLLELVLVMVLITLALGAAAPSLRGFWRSTHVKDAAAQLVSVTQWARSHAISEGRVYRLNVGQNKYWMSVLVQQEFVAPESDFGKEFEMPEGMSLTLTRSDGLGEQYVDFFADGRTEPAEMKVVGNDGYDEIRMICLSPTERFHIALPNETLVRR